jgi:hypothetical protein
VPGQDLVSEQDLVSTIAGPVLVRFSARVRAVVRFL